MALQLFRNWWLLALKGLLLLLMGLFTLFNTELALGGIVLYLGIMVLVGGVAEVLVAFLNRDNPQWTSFLLEGLVDIVIGVLLLSRPEVIGLIPILLGIWIAISGMLLLVRSLRERKEGNAAWLNWLALSVVLLFIGIWLVADPLGSLISITWLLGIVLVVFGLLILMIAFRLKRARGHLKDLRDQ